VVVAVVATLVASRVAVAAVAVAGDKPHFTLTLISPLSSVLVRQVRTTLVLRLELSQVSVMLFLLLVVVVVEVMIIL
jgi:hypothetical protein